MDKQNDESQLIIGVLGVVVIWGTVGMIMLINVLMYLFTTGDVQPLTVVLLVAAVVTVTGALSGNRIRRATGFLWVALGVLGFVMFVISAGLEAHWLEGKSVSVLLVSLISAYLLFLPDKK